MVHAIKNNPEGLFFSLFRGKCDIMKMFENKSDGGQRMIHIDRKQIDEVYTMRDAIESVRRALILHDEGKTQVPVRTGLTLESKQATCLFMPGAIESMDLVGVKIVSVFPQNSRKGLENVPAEMVLLDGETGYVKAMINGTRLTEMRTGAVTAVATDLICQRNIERAAIIGTGGQAPCQIEGLLSVRDVRTVAVAARDFKKTKEFVQRMEDAFKERCETTFVACENIEEAVEGADIIYTVTTSRVPFIKTEMLKQNAHINAVGSFKPEMQEIDEAVMGMASFILMDNLEGALKEAGDLLIPVAKGLLQKSSLTSELGAYVAGRKTYTPVSGVTVFKTVGFGALDLVVAHDILKKVENR